MKYLLLLAAIVAVIATQTVSASSVAVAGCHNATGSCTPAAFICANEEAIPHAKRCDGVEDCADGTDEYMCDQAPTPLHDLSVQKRTAITEVACIQCTCWKGTILIPSTNIPWFRTAVNAPRDNKMMTDAPQAGVLNRPCHPTNTNSILLNVYKKQNKGCRGWVCCFRQETCNCGTSTTARHCWP